MAYSHITHCGVLVDSICFASAGTSCLILSTNSPTVIPLGASPIFTATAVHKKTMFKDGETSSYVMRNLLSEDVFGAHIFKATQTSSGFKSASSISMISLE